MYSAQNRSVQTIIMSGQILFCGHTQDVRCFIDIVLSLSAKCTWPMVHNASALITSHYSYAPTPDWGITCSDRVNKHVYYIMQCHYYSAFVEL